MHVQCLHSCHAAGGVAAAVGEQQEGQQDAASDDMDMEVAQAEAEQSEGEEGVGSGDENDPWVHRMDAASDEQLEHARNWRPGLDQDDGHKPYDDMSGRAMYAAYTLPDHSPPTDRARLRELTLQLLALRTRRAATEATIPDVNSSGAIPLEEDDSKPLAQDQQVAHGLGGMGGAGGNTDEKLKTYSKPDVLTVKMRSITA